MVFTTYGANTRGGIDRMMDLVRTKLAQGLPPGVGASFITARGPGSLVLAPLYLVASIVRIAFRRALGRVQLLHINLASYGSTYRKILLGYTARFLGIPYIVHLHSGKYPDFWNNAPAWTSRAIHTLFQRAAAILVLGEVWADFVRNRVPGHPPIIVLPNATADPGPIQYRRPGDKAHIVFLGVLARTKGVFDLLDALSRLTEDGVPYRATIAGNGDREAVRDYAAKKKLGDAARMVGWISPEEVSRLLGEADILALPSHWENLPMVIVEAFAHGVAVVATPVGAIPELVEEGATGMLVPVGDVDALAKALTRLARERDFGRRLGAAGRRVYEERLTIERYVERLVEIWRAAARGEIRP